MDGRQYSRLIVLLDGASASGKSTIKNRLLADPELGFQYVRRYTTRAQRPDDVASLDYIFMTLADFRQREIAGELLEWRHFLFGMSYGLGWPEIRNGMVSGKNLLAVMNLGNVGRVKQQLAESVCVLVDAPADQIERRFRARLERFTRNLVVLYGGMNATERRTAEEGLKRPDTEERLVLATGRYLGEGFDDASLDTLFLTMPISWKGTLAQYVGRLHREHHAKREVVVYDYVDSGVPMLARMALKRQSGYRSLGYVVASK